MVMCYSVSIVILHAAACHLHVRATGLGHNMISLVEDIHSGAALTMANNVLMQRQKDCEWGSSIVKDCMHTPAAAAEAAALSSRCLLPQDAGCSWSVAQSSTAGSVRLYPGII